MNCSARELLHFVGVPGMTSTGEVLPSAGCCVLGSEARRAARVANRPSPTECRARLRVFFISIAIVIGPTPPGTGVMAAATLAHGTLTISHISLSSGYVSLHTRQYVFGAV